MCIRDSFHAVRKQNNGCDFLRKLQHFCGLSYRIRQGRFAPWLKVGDQRSYVGTAVRGGEEFDISAIATTAVTVGNEAGIGVVCLPVRGKIVKCIACNLDLSDAINLSPH